MPPVTDKDQAHVNATVALPLLPSLPPTLSGDLAQRDDVASTQDETDLSLPLPQMLPIDSDTDLGANASSDGRKNRALRQRQKRSLQIQAVARSLFAKRGYHETSIQEIIDGAGIARGTFYLHFDSKRAIFGQLIDDFLLRIRSGLTTVDISPGAPPPLVQLRENVLRIIQVLSENRDLTRIILLLAEGLDADCDAKLAEFYGTVRALLWNAITQGQRIGLVRPCEPQIAAQAALGSLKEVVLQWIVRRDSSHAELLQVCSEILAYSLHGLFLNNS